MSGLLNDLAARFAPQAAAPIQPRPAFRFEGDSDADGFHEIATEARAPAAHADHTLLRPHQAAPPPMRDGAPSQPGPAPTAFAAPPSARGARETPRAVEARQATMRAAPDTYPEAETAAPTTEDAGRTPQATVERTRTHETLHERIETVQIVQSPPGSAERTGPTENTRPALPVSPHPETAPAEPALERMAEPTLAAPSIRIGRIEVRTPAKPAPPPAPPRPAPAPTTQTARSAPAPAAPARSGLTDYLGWRR